MEPQVNLPIIVLCRLSVNEFKGAVGKQLLTDLLQNGNYAKVVAVGRRNVKLEETISQEKLVRV